MVDKRKLDPWLMAADLCLPALCGMDLGYTGHYVLLAGFDGAANEYVVRDPAAAMEDLRVSVAALELARRSFGTDEDILVISHPHPGTAAAAAAVRDGSCGGDHKSALA